MNGPFVVLSGACGTELERRGVATPLPLWSAAAMRDDPDAVRAVHADQVRAGADIVVANTFRTQRRTLARAGVSARETRTWVKRAVRLARDAVAGSSAAVAGSIAPLEDCFRPDLVPDDATLRAEHGMAVGDLVAARVDLAVVETMNTVREAVAALGACQAAQLPAAVAFTCAPGARLRSGEPVADAVAAVLATRPLAVMVNCCPVPTATEALVAIVAALRAAGAYPMIAAGVYANGMGAPDDERGWRFDVPGGTDRTSYVKAADGWIDAGATWIGGCCGTTPETVADLRALVGTRASR